MKTFLKFFGILLLSFVVVGLVIPNHINIQRSIEIKAPSEAVHAFVNDLEKWPSWSPWMKMDDSIKTTLGDIHQGVGASQSWTSISGNGTIKLTGSSAKDGIEYLMAFEGEPTQYQAGFNYQSEAGSTLVTWYMTGDMKPIIIGNYFALIMDSLIGPTFDQGLQSLKQQVEADVPLMKTDAEIESEAKTNSPTISGS